MHSCVWRIHVCDAFMCVTHWYVWLIHVCDAFMCVIWDMTHSYVRRATRCIHMSAMPHSYVWHDSFICVTHSCVRHATWLIHIQQLFGARGTYLNCLTQYVWRIHMCDAFMCVTHSCVWRIHVCDAYLNCLTQTRSLPHPPRYDSLIYKTWLINI